MIFWKFICDQNGTHSGLFIPSFNRPEKRHTILWTAPNTSSLLAQLLVVHGKGRRGRLQASSLLFSGFHANEARVMGSKKISQIQEWRENPACPPLVTVTPTHSAEPARR